MKTVLFIILLIAASVIVIYAARKVIEGVANLVIVLNRRKRPDLPVQRNGIVFNKKTGKLEADQTCISKKPFW